MIAPTTYQVADPVAPTPSGSWLTQFARLVRWELFLAWRRRAMLITLSSLFLVGYLLVVLFEYAIYFSGSAATAQSLSEALTFPGSLSSGGAYVGSAGVLLFVVLTGTLIGSEYSYTTLRLSLSRGIARGQLLAAQIVALAILALILTAATLLLSTLTGGVSLLLGVSQSITAGASFGEVMLYWLALTYNIFAYALVSLWIGTLTRSIAGAIAGPLVILVIEVISTEILTAVGEGSGNSPLLRAIAHIPEYLMGVNTGALVTLAGAGPYPLTSGQTGVAEVDIWHALIVSAIYCALFILISYLLLRNRDVLE